ncbi:DNA-binding transcriptional regulator, ArsR family [Flavobacterium longum]|uniref:ArsR/SmtB family transcription factor n=1 Tax=Flavobacterium longum TaxID=1299340 RepID=UPI0039EA7FAE
MKRDIFQALADPTRRAILMLLATQSMTPNAIAAHFDMTRQAVSKHIQYLADSEIIGPEKNGREIMYHVNPDQMKAFDHWLEQFRNLLEKRFSQLDDLLNNLKD